MPNLADILYRRARATPAAIAYRFIQGPALVATEMNYQQLWLLASKLAIALQDRELAGARVLLVCRSQRNFVISFFACLLSGVIAVPTALPRRKNLVGRMQVLMADAQISAIMSDADEMEVLVAANAKIVYLDLQSWLHACEHQVHADVPTRHLPPVPENAIAFLQYTSGSTGDPKGVVITHANLMANSAVIQQAMEISSDSAVFTALPLFHDMGLVGGVLQPMYSGCVGNCMSPAEFVQYPERWLQIMSAFKITISGGANFMYELAARSIESGHIEGCDLSHWKLAFCGAEPVRIATIRYFTERFAGLGFQGDVFYPCYGMAESTLFITGKVVRNTPDVSQHEGKEIVGCGIVHGDTEVIIVNPETRVIVPDTAVGEIWVRGTSVAKGYWQRPELSSATFHARLADGNGKEYLRTGDLGFIEGAQLYITSRLKDLIIAYGKKYAPQDIEGDAEFSHAALGKGGGAAFSIIDDGVERVVLVFELRREWLRRHFEWHAVASAVRAAVISAHGLVLDDVVFIKPGALPRTSSGKVRRSQCRIDYLAGTLECAQPPNHIDVAFVAGNAGIRPQLPGAGRYIFKESNDHI